MKKISINLFAIAVILTILLSNAFPTSVLGQEKYSVKGEIIYWWPEGQILVWLLKKEERKINKELIPQTRSLKIELDTKEGEKKEVKARKVTFKFTDVPRGTYGILCVLDTNKNGKLDYPEGFEPGTVQPIEPYAYSGPKGLGGPSPFDDIKFKVEEDISGLKIELR